MPLWCQQIIVCLIKKSECKIKGDFEGSVPSSIEISSLSCYDPFLKKWEKDMVCMAGR
jgi:hypothetical protein